MDSINKGYRNALRSLGALFSAALLYSCASIGNPSGGPRDEDPPLVVRTSPVRESTDFKGNSVSIEFNELVNVKDAFTNVVVSPPQARAPKVTASGRRIIVEWDEALLPDTTYTIDFGTAIEDVNEGNRLGNYSFTFSTGPALDSLRISGIVLEAATLEPQKGVLVGVHSAEAPDSALRTLRFERVTKTDDRGRFTLRGLKAKPYNVYALADLNNDYRWDNPAEFLAFYPVPVTPYSEKGLASDTIFNLLTGEVDTVMSREKTIFLPDNLLLSTFDTGYKPQYLVKYERPDSLRLEFIFNTKADSLPGIRFLGINPSERWSIPEYSLNRDTVTCWLTDPLLVKADTLKVALSYPRTDQYQKLIPGTDTLTIARPKVRLAPKRKLNRQQQQADSIAREKARWIELTMSPSGTMDVYSPLVIETPEPLVTFREGMMRLEEKKDSTYQPLPAPHLRQDSTGSVRRYTLRYPWEYGKAYRLTIDSTAMTGVSGRPNATLRQDFNIKKREDYAALTLRLTPDTLQGYVEILNSSDKPVARARVINGIVSFPYLAPQEYYARFVTRPMPTDSLAKDELIFHTGNYDTRTQPDEVYYYPKKLSLKRMDRSEHWDLNGTAVDLQKPDAIKANKPETKKASRKDKRGENGAEGTDEEEDYFDVNRNPFDNKSKSKRGRGNNNSYNIR